MASLRDRVYDPSAWYAPLVSLLRGLLDRWGRSNAMLAGSGAAFWVVLAIVPSLLALISLAGLWIDPVRIIAQLEEMVGEFSPQLEDFLETIAARITASTTGLSISLVVSVIAALWSSSTGVMYLMRAVTMAYAIPETRSYVRQRGKALGIALTGVVVLVAVLVLPLVLPPILADLTALMRNLLVLGGGAVDFLVLTWLFVLFYGHATPVHVGDWQDRVPGAVVAAVSWSAGTVAFNIYAVNFSNYANVYGTLAGVVLAMLLIWVLVLFLLGGATINAELAARRGTVAPGSFSLRQPQQPPPQQPPEEGADPDDGNPAGAAADDAPNDDTATADSKRVVS